MPKLTLSDSDSLWFEHAGSGLTVFFVSGLGGIGDFWHPFIERFAREYLAVTHDHRGTGRSSRRPINFSVDQMAGDVIELADHLGIENFHVVGHSTGGAIAQTLALDFPDRISSVVLSATWAGPDNYVRSLFSLRRDVLENMGMTAYRRMSSLMLGPPKSFIDLMPKDVDITASAKALTEDGVNLSRRIRALLDFDRRQELSRLTLPVHVVCAEDDIIIPPHLSREIHTLIPNSTLKVYPEGGHVFPQKHSHEFSEDVLGFLASGNRRV